MRRPTIGFGPLDQPPGERLAVRCGVPLGGCPVGIGVPTVGDDGRRRRLRETEFGRIRLIPRFGCRGVEAVDKKEQFAGPVERPVPVGRDSGWSASVRPVAGGDRGVRFGCGVVPVIAAQRSRNVEAATADEAERPGDTGQYASSVERPPARWRRFGGDTCSRGGMTK